MQNVLVTGGAGYIGSHTCLALSEKGFNPVVFDNLSNGHLSFVKWGPFEQGDLTDKTCILQVIRRYKPVAIIHFAALIEVADSTAKPMEFFYNNVYGTIVLLQAALEAGIDKLVFSSTCATYGTPHYLPIDENHKQSPINPYGQTKLMGEQMLAELSRYKSLRSVSLRYFNAAGADAQGRIGERHNPETHVVPLAIQAALGLRKEFWIYGTDYETRDGTCVRDFVHVMDLAEAHCSALTYLLQGGATTAINLGSGNGTTVSELVAAVREISGRSFTVRSKPRRVGDPPTLVADAELAKSVLKWSPVRDLKTIIKSAWDWHTKHV